MSWARQLEVEGLVRLQSFRGVTGQWILLPRLHHENVGLVTVWNRTGASLYLWRSERLAPESLARVEEVTGRRMGPGTGAGEVSEALLSALEDAYREAARVVAQPSD